MSRNKNRGALVGAYALYVALAFAPTAVALALDWNAYTATPASSVSLGVFGVLAVLLVGTQLLGHTPKKVRRVVWYSAAAACLWALQPIVQSLAVLVTCMAAGEWGALLVANPLIRRLRRQIADERTAGVVAEAVGRAQGRV